MQFFWVFLGGGLGSICRYSLSIIFPAKGAGFPWATFSANLIACFLLGLLYAYLSKQAINATQEALKLALLTGFCGGFSTFSTFSNECLQLLQKQAWGLALTYILVSLILGIFLAFAGYKLLA